MKRPKQAKVATHVGRIAGNNTRTQNTKRWQENGIGWWRDIALMATKFNTNGYIPKAFVFLVEFEYSCG
jgi:hypothetical protein